MARHWIAAQWGTPESWTFVEYDVVPPAQGEVTIRVHAAGVNPADAKHVAAARPGAELPGLVGYEISGELTAIGPETQIGSGSAAVGAEVLAFRVQGGYATEITVPAEKVFAKPASVSHPEAANLLLAGATAADMLRAVAAVEGETILLHGASGAVGVAVLQLAARQKVRVIGTASESNAERVRSFDGVPVVYGPGLTDRVREALAELGVERVDAALDAVGTDEATEVSLAWVPDLERIVTVAAAGNASEHGFKALGGTYPESAAYRDSIRGELIDLAGRGLLQVPMARTYPLADAKAAHRLLATGHPGGKIALIP